MFKRKKTVPRPEGPLTEESLRRWLVDYLAVHVEIPRDSIDTSRTFEAHGLDSRVAVQVSGALEKVVERRLSPGLLYEHQSIDALSAYLARELRL
ncbi:acyl carrier protein [Streptomyces somaliensis]|uniref:acyl carrier protein n=1 Tax=Streptomyces somaliensis TaxID=78355 RepID=UPI0020CCF086|nr:acyl carrier protein [Streptomyces somaliensis]MCP9943732.1 acyl carrier protein [Streptomyces somaliensis]MCP9963023.1 acyl carrier protein [Streptomyces somaliensis]MCP9975873.1 acyl carrier protein [Streptomyces somaliensis]